VTYPDEPIRAVLRTRWQRTPEAITPLSVGSGVRAWRVSARDERLVARLVPVSDRTRAEAGLAAMEHLAGHGFCVGRPVRTVDAALTVDVPGGVLELVRDVPGRPLEAADPLDQQWWGDLLGRVHRRLAAFEHPGLLRWHWVRPEAGHLRLEPWLRPAITGAVNALAKLAVTDQLSYGVVHGDPAARVFRIDVNTGRTGLLGWGVAATGPLVYDLAAAVIDAGGPAAATELLDGYAAAAPVTRDEIDVALPVLLRFRWAVLADFCARRLTAAERAMAGSGGVSLEAAGGVSRGADGGTADGTGDGDAPEPVGDESRARRAGAQDDFAAERTLLAEARSVIGKDGQR
jgi:homoserine kinase type II